MKKFLSTKYLTSICFLGLLALMLAGSLKPGFYAAYHQLQNIRNGDGISVDQVEYEYNDSLPGKETYITLNGGFQRLMGLREVNQRYRMDNGHLTYIVPRQDVTQMAENTIAFRDALAEMDVPFVYVNTLFKIDPEDKQLPLSVEDYSGENADRFLALLEEGGVDTLDLRQVEKQQGLDHYSLFFKTDHHWTPETGFWAYTQIVSWLAEQDDSFAVDSALTQAENYDHVIYEDIFCGSAARRMGRLYAGLDDLTVITPRFETALRAEMPDMELSRQGSYAETLLFPEHLTRENMLETSAYGVYMGEDQSIVSITNLSGEQGLECRSREKKLLILKDSSALVVLPYLALSYDAVTCVDLRLYGGDLLEFIREYQPDLVMTLYNPGALETHNLSMFQFLR